MHFSAGSAINAAIEGLTRALALELSPLRVNAISPGTVATPVWDVVPEQARLTEFEETAKKLPAKRIGQPEDIAQAAVYLIQCGYATGSVVYVDGGARMVKQQFFCNFDLLLLFSPQFIRFSNSGLATDSYPNIAFPLSILHGFRLSHRSLTGALMQGSEIIQPLLFVA